MATTTTNLNPADALRALIARGVERFEASLPDFARGSQVADEPIQPNVSDVTEAQQILICLNCSLADCIGV